VPAECIDERRINPINATEAAKAKIDYIVLAYYGFCSAQERCN
jgi:hypothetical protein